MNTVLSGCAVRAEIQKSDAELARLREIEHRVWHLFDDSEQRDDEIICMRGVDYEELCKLLPENHPRTDPIVPVPMSQLWIRVDTNGIPIQDSALFTIEPPGYPGVHPVTGTRWQKITYLAAAASEQRGDGEAWK